MSLVDIHVRRRDIGALENEKLTRANQNNIKVKVQDH